MHKNATAISLLILGLGAAACSPSVNSFTATAGSDINVVNVSASISGAAAINLQTPTLGVRRVGGASFANVPQFVATGGTSYVRSDLALPAGQY